LPSNCENKLMQMKRTKVDILYLDTEDLNGKIIFKFHNGTLQILSIDDSPRKNFNESVITHKLKNNMIGK